MSLTMLRLMDRLTRYVLVSINLVSLLRAMFNR